MSEKLVLPNQLIIDCMRTIYDIKVATLTFLPLGADVDACVFKAQADQSAYFVKLKRDFHQNIGPQLQLILQNAGNAHVIAPLTTIHGQTAHHLNDLALTVYPFIEGQDGFSRSLSADQWIMLGKALRQVHEFNLPSAIKDQIKWETYSPQSREVVRLMYSNLDDGLSVVDEIAAKFIATVKEKREIINQLVNRAEQLADKIQKQPSTLVLCHSDIHAGNVLLANDGALYIVDWDQPIMAPKERDLMFIGGGVASVWNDPREEEFFYQGYGKTDINRDILAYYRHERIVQDIAEYYNELLLSTNGVKEREIMYQHFLAMFEPQGVVDIAFKTLGSF